MTGPSPWLRGKGDRETRLSEAVQDAIVAAVRSGAPMHTALKAAGIGEGTYYEWAAIATGRQHTWNAGGVVSPAVKAVLMSFYERVTRAKAERELDAVKRIEESAKTLDKVGRPDWRADAWLLQYGPQYRRDWHQHNQSEVTVTLDPRVAEIHRQVAAKTTEELLALAPEEYRGLVDET